MRITITELKQIIRSVMNECYGWPTESEKPLYGIRSSLGKPSPNDGKNSPLRFPRGKNSKGKINESFSKITAKELSEWQSGNWGFMHEDASTHEVCEACGGVVGDRNSIIPENMEECNCG